MRPYSSYWFVVSQMWLGVGWLAFPTGHWQFPLVVGLACAVVDFYFTVTRP